MSYTITDTIGPDGKPVTSITCGQCKRTSYNANDVANRYCSCCHVYHHERTESLPQPKMPKDELTCAHCDGKEMGSFGPLWYRVINGGNVVYFCCRDHLVKFFLKPTMQCAQCGTSSFEPGKWFRIYHAGKEVDFCCREHASIFLTQ